MQPWSTLVANLITLIAISTTVSAGDEVLLWPQEHPANTRGGAPTVEVRPNRVVVRHSPTLTAFLPEKNPTQAAVMVVPGGGYALLAVDHEGEDAAKWLAERGVAGIVLKYRCGGAPNGHPAPLEDALRGMRLIRSKAEEWNIDTGRVGVWGFSAGGHLASCVSTLSDDGDASNSDPVEKQSSRSNFSVLAYPVTSMEPGIVHGGSFKALGGESADEATLTRLSTHKQVSKESPPTFIVATSDDTAVVPENSLRYYQALVAANVSVEMHLFAKGGHGFGMRKNNKPLDAWLPLLERWLKSEGVVEN